MTQVMKGWAANFSFNKLASSGVAKNLSALGTCNNLKTMILLKTLSAKKFALNLRLPVYAKNETYLLNYNQVAPVVNKFPLHQKQYHMDHSH